MDGRPRGAPAVTSMLAAALAFGGLVVATPIAAYLLRDSLSGGGPAAVVTFLTLGLVLLALCVACLALFGCAARRLVRPPAAPAGTDTTVILMTAFAFDADDLDANRQGRLSARQRLNLRATNQVMIIMGTVMVGVTYLFLAFMPWLMNGSGSSSSADHLGYVVGVGLITALLSGSMLRGYWQMRGQVHGWVAVAHGAAEPPTRGTDPATRALLTARVGSLAVPLVSAEQASALVTGRLYRVYYLPGPLPRVLSVDEG